MCTSGCWGILRNAEWASARNCANGFVQSIGMKTRVAFFLPNQSRPALNNATTPAPNQSGQIGMEVDNVSVTVPKPASLLPVFVKFFVVAGLPSVKNSGPALQYTNG